MLKMPSLIRTICYENVSLTGGRTIWKMYRKGSNNSVWMFMECVWVSRARETIFRMSHIPPQQTKVKVICSAIVSEQLNVYSGHKTFMHAHRLMHQRRTTIKEHLSPHVRIGAALNLLRSAHSSAGTALCRFQLSSPCPGSSTGVEGRWWSIAKL